MQYSYPRECGGDPTNFGDKWFYALLSPRMRG